jgi:hypothetical protein
MPLYLVRYHNPDHKVIGLAIVGATGRSLSGFLTQRLGNPTHMRRVRALFASKTAPDL